MNLMKLKTMQEHDPIIHLAAHDLRAPLMSVKGLIHLMKMDADKNNHDHYFSLLETSIEKLNQSISTIIINSKNGFDSVAPQEINFTRLIDDSIQSLQYMAGAESVRIDVNIQDGITFFSDHNCLKSIFTNIISNAIHYRDTTKNSYLKIDVTFTNDGVRSVFEDNGIGIAEQYQEKIFDRFFRVNHDHEEGSGLGLYLVKYSVDKMRGSIRLESELGEGTAFSVYTPNMAIRRGKMIISKSKPVL